MLSAEIKGAPLTIMPTETQRAPTGEVTFLFTDIVGSTEMWERLGDGFLPVLQAHNAILSDAIADTAVSLRPKATLTRSPFYNPPMQHTVRSSPRPPYSGIHGPRMWIKCALGWRSIRRIIVQAGDYFEPPI